MTPSELEDFVEEHGPRWRLIAAQWSDAPDDLVQEALLRLIREEPKPDNAFAWMIRVIRNLAMSQVRRQTVRSKHRDQLQSHEQTRHARTGSDGSEWLDIEIALQQLSPNVRKAVVLKIWGNLKFVEIANLLDCGTTTAHRLYNEGIELLRTLLEDDEATSSEHRIEDPETIPNDCRNIRE